LVNNANKILVSSVDAKNFEETDTLAEFLKRYDCLDNVSETKKYIRRTPVEKENPEYIAEEERYQKAYDDWLANEKPKTITLEGEPAYTERVHTNPIYKEIMSSYNQCMQLTFDGKNCYMHVLTDLLGPGTYTTSPDPNTGETHEYIIYDGDCKNPEHEGFHGQESGQSWGWCWQSSKEYGNYSQFVHDYINDENHKVYNHEHHENEHWDTVDITYQDKVYRDMQTYCDGTCDPNMSIKQRMVDLLWKFHDAYVLTSSSGGYANRQYRAEFFHFLEFDLDEAKLVEHEAVPGGEIENPDYAKWLEDEPKKTEYPKTITEYEEEPYAVVEEKLTIIDPEKAQWYTNLWYRMNGMDEPERIYKDINDVVNDRQEDTTRTDYLLKLFDLQKQTYFVNYDVLDSNLVSSKDWLNNALSQGLVTMQKVGASRTVNNDKFKWSSIIYTNATDIISQKDDTKIAQAEARYTQVLSEVNAKDKVFENKIRKLDTEHNALQTEYNSVKAAMDKNIERSFKAFQG
jgi:hypothetical protein